MRQTGILFTFAFMLVAWPARAQDDPVAPVPPVASDAQTLTAAEALAVDAAFYAEQFGVTQDEAARRLSVMLYAEDEVLSVAREEGADFAGEFFDNASSFAVVVRTTKAVRADRRITRRATRQSDRESRDPAARAERRAARRALRTRFRVSDAQVDRAEEILATDLAVPVRYRVQAPRSLRDLNAALKIAFPGLARVSGFQTAFVDQRTGEIVAMVDTTDQAGAERAVSTVLSLPHRVELVPGGFVDVALRGGLFTQVPAQRWCMTAFGATRTSDRRTGVVTAGHCASSSQISMTSSDGSSVNLTQGTPLNDLATGDLMFLSGTPAGSAQFRFDGTGAFRTVSGFRSRSSTTVGDGGFSAPSTVAGSFVCHVGQESLGSPNIIQSCGEVVSTTGHRGTSSLSGGNYVIVRNTQSGAGAPRTSGSGTLRCFQGDSGGPWFAGTVAFGVMSACQWEGGTMNGTTRWSMYTSVSEFNLIGVTLLVP